MYTILSVQLILLLWIAVITEAFIFSYRKSVSPTFITTSAFAVPNTNDWNNEEDNKRKQEKDISVSVRLSDEERLQKVISRAGVASRRDAEKMIIDGRVVVNGKIVTELGLKIKPRKDTVVVDGKKIQLPDSNNVFWVLLYKPKDVITTLEDSKDRNTISTFVPKAKELRLLPVGRLDRASSGLLILTNENGWIHPLTHPSVN